MENGYIKLWRKTLRSDMYKSLTAVQRDVMITCLMLANHTPNKWEWQGQIFTCEQGQFITSLASLASKCSKGVTTKMVRNSLLKLEKWDFLASQGAKTGRLITIKNWGTYQSSQTEEGKDKGKRGAKRGQSLGKRRATNKNVKNVKNDKNKDIGEIIELPSWIPREEWEDFLKTRRSNGKAVKTEKAFKLLISSLEKLKDQGEDLRAVLNQSIERSYQGLFPVKDKGVGNKTTHEKNMEELRKFGEGMEVK